jgi:hypothetical protein
MAQRLMVSPIIPRPIPRILIDCPPLLTLLRSGRHRGIGATRGSIGELSVAAVRWAMTSTSTTKCLYLAIEGGYTQRVLTAPRDPAGLKVLLREHNDVS